MKWCEAEGYDKMTVSRYMRFSVTAGYQTYTDFRDSIEPSRKSSKARSSVHAIRTPWE